MEQFIVYPVGKIHNRGGECFIQLDRQYFPALKALDGFSHLNVFWWLSECDFEEARNLLETPQPYKNAPDEMGIFATRSPARPNPIALSTVTVLDINPDEGMIRTPYIDANDGSPVLDLKPYTPSMDRIERPTVPAWCSHWPKSVEESGQFDWSQEFTF